MVKINAVVGNNIRRYRKLRHLTQEILAEKLDVSTIYISYLERGSKVPSLELLVKIANVLEVEPAMLLLPDQEPKNYKIKALIDLLNSLDERTVGFVDEMIHAVVKLQNS